MKVIYNTCFADPWIQVAQKLKKEYNYNPVYWIGYNDDNSELLVKENFPECIYHPYFDAWKGIFPSAVVSNLNNSQINIDFLKEYSGYELQAIKMMDRMDSDQESFSFMERQRLYRQLVKGWITYLKNNNPDLVISAIVPHRVYDYVLYLLCQYLSIQFLTFKDTAFKGRIIPVKNVYSIIDKVRVDYKKIIKSTTNVDELKEKIENDIYDRYLKVQEGYEKAVPDYMKRHIKNDKQDSNLIGLSKRFIVRIIKNKNQFLGKNRYLFRGIPTYHKQKKRAIEDSHFTILEHAIRKLKANRFKKSLKKYYSTLTTYSDENETYIFLPLHYQPEMTSNPSGDIFVDQLLCVDVLSNNLPDNYKIYVKEHPSQFRSHTEGHTGRIKKFYDDLKQYEKVKLISLDSDPFKLMRNSAAVATLTGTAGWEAIVLKKPVIIFGLAWYEGYEGVLKVGNVKTASRIYSFIKDYKFDEKDLISYLLAFQNNSLLAYYYRGLKTRMNQSEEECVENIVNCIISNI